MTVWGSGGRSIITAAAGRHASSALVLALLLALTVVSTTAAAQVSPPAGAASEVVVTGRSGDLIGIATSSNQGQISAADLALRPLFRPGEVVEQIPGVIVTQHSGSGKANQYFLRGFNLDHGTDLAVSLDDVPVNMPSHAHGEGYADLNFLIPELVERIDYEKGPYYAEVGDFGSAGAFDLHYYDRLPAGLLRLEGGEVGYERGVLADSVRVGASALLYAGEIEHNDGPWAKGDDERKLDGVIRYASGDRANGWSLTAMAYHNIWNSTDQVPDRAIVGAPDPVGAPAPPALDLISRFGQVDPSDGGRTGRYALTGEIRRTDGDVSQRLAVYGLYYDLRLFSDFTYFLEDPVHGDQIEQQDKRYVAGLEAAQTWRRVLSLNSDLTLGLQNRNDVIHNGLYHTERRDRLSATTVDDIQESSVSPYVEDQTRWTPWLRTILGARLDAIWMKVDSLAGGASGGKDQQIVSPKAALILGPWARTEVYLDWGEGFHSNDARGVVAAAGPATALPRSQGSEVGLRTTFVPHLRSEFSLWQLDLQSELVWDGDAGTNDPAGPTHRYGVEFANWYTPFRWLTVDADYAWSHTRFTDDEPDGPYVPEALVSTFDGGVALHDLPGRAAPWTAGLRLRYFGPRPLTQDDAVRSRSTTLLYANFGYRLTRSITMALDVFNLLDAKTSDIDYYYTSRLPGEPLSGVNDIHTHPSEPQEVRVSLTSSF